MTPKEYYFKQLLPYITTKLPDAATIQCKAKELFGEELEWSEDILEKYGSPENIPPGRTFILEELSYEVASWFSLKDQGHEFGPRFDVARALRQGTIYVAEYPTDEVNACICFIAEASGYLILVNYGLLNLVGEILKLTISFIPESQKKKWGAQFAFMTRDKAASYIRHLIDAYRDTGQVPVIGPQNPQLPDSEPLQLLWGDIVFGVNKFVIAHEFAHYLLGHLSPMSVRKLAVPGSNVSLDILVRNHEEELEADELAAIAPIVHKVQNDHVESVDSEVRHIVQAPLFFFSIVELIDTAFGNAPSATHPSSKERYRHVREIYEQQISESAFVYYDFYREFLNDVNASL